MANDGQERCPKCGALLGLVGRSHLCIAVPVGENLTEIAQRVSYRYRNVEKRRAYMRDYMRKRRSKR